MEQLLDIDNYSQPVVIVDHDENPMSLEQQLQYMKERRGENCRRW